MKTLPRSRQTTTTRDAGSARRWLLRVLRAEAANVDERTALNKAVAVLADIERRTSHSGKT